jgi:predicted acyltransferase
MTDSQQHTPSFSGRLMALDALRGFDMFWIIGGEELFRALAPLFPGRITQSINLQLQHVPWQGLHFYDVIWPLFMFMVGVAMRLSWEKRKSAGGTKRILCLHAMKRALILFFLGMVAQGNLLYFDLSQLHPCYSVLHGIAAGYLIATLVMVYLSPKAQLITMAGCLLGYWALLMQIPVPGFGRGVLTAEGNAAAYIDRLVLGGFHYGKNTWFLSYLGFASSVLLGVMAGEILLSRKSPHAKVVRLWLAGVLALALGLAWSIFFPIIKLLWTSSYVLVAGGISFILLGIFYLVIDVWGFRKWAFGFTVIGLNSIAAYMAMMLFDFRQVGNIFVGHLLSRVGLWNNLLEAAAAFTVFWLILYWMYRTKTFLKL